MCVRFAMGALSVDSSLVPLRSFQMYGGLQKHGEGEHARAPPELLMLHAAGFQFSFVAGPFVAVWGPSGSVAG